MGKAQYSNNKDRAFVKTIQRMLVVPEVPIAFFILVFVVVISVTAQYFFTSSNMLLVSKQLAINGILALAMALSIISGGLDLSVGSMLGALLTFAGTMGLTYHLPYSMVFILTLLVGAGCGAVNGIAIVGLSVPPIIVTLGTMNAFKGVVLVITNGSWFTGFPPVYRQIGNGFIPFSILVTLTVFMSIMMKKTRFGRHIRSMGGSESSARLAGINVKRTKFFVYVICGILVGLATMIYLGRAGVGEPTAGTGYETQALAAAVVGGVSFIGGRGSMLGAFLGAVLMGFLLNGMVSLQISSYYQGIVTGLVIVLALVMEMVRNNYLKRLTL